MVSYLLPFYVHVHTTLVLQWQSIKRFFLDAYEFSGLLDSTPDGVVMVKMVIAIKKGGFLDFILEHPVRNTFLTSVAHRLDYYCLFYVPHYRKVLEE